MDYYYKSYYIKYANQKLKWLPMDTEELYNENLKKNYNLLEKNNWIDKAIDYTFNSEGFRCDEFSSEPSIVFLGCSYTMGIGLNIEQCWPTIVAKKLNLRCYNLGIGGSSCDTAFRLGLHYIVKIKPKIVIFLQPSQYRLEAINIDNAGPVTMYSANTNVNYNHEDYLHHYFVDQNNSFLNREKNTLAINHICDMNNIKFISIDYKKFTDTHVDLARDLAHYGPKTNLMFAYKLLDFI